MTLLTVNTGSSSVRIVAFREARGGLERLAGDRLTYDQRDPRELLTQFTRQYGVSGITSVAHRIVHGGDRLTHSCPVDAGVEAEIDRASELAPLHNRRALRWIHASADVVGEEAAQIAVFDTAFFANLPVVARTYALPRELAERHRLRRFGFHGLAHEAMWRRWRAQRQQVPMPRVISIQLGAGCSMAAIRDGQPVDTSMGFSPLEGLVMATRAGDLDPGMLSYLQRAEDLSPAQLDLLLNQACGLLGLSGLSGDMRQLLAQDAPEAKLAVDVYCYRARKYLGAYLAALGGADAIIFGGGVGENAPEVRARIVAGMEWCGLRLDSVANNHAVGRDARVSTSDSEIEIWVLPVDESLILAEEGMRVLKEMARHR